MKNLTRMNKILIAIISILVVGIVIVGVVILNNNKKFESENTTKTNGVNNGTSDSSSDNVNENNTGTNVTGTNCSKGSGVVPAANNLYDNKEVSYEYCLVEFGNEGTGYLMIYGKTLNLKPFNSIESVRIMKDNIIVVETHTGGDIHGYAVSAFNKSGKELLYIQNLDTNGRMYMRSSSVKVESNRLVIQGTRLTHGPAIHTTATDEGIGLLKQVNGQNVYVDTIGDSEVLESEFEVKYLGSEKFGSPTKVRDTMTFGQYKANNPLN